MKNFSILVQGPIHPNSILTAILYEKYNTVISTWSADYEKESELFRHICKYDSKIIAKPLPETEDINNIANRYFQFCSLYNGLSIIDTEYVIKLRSDEYYTNLSPIIEKVLINPNKLITNDVFFRKSKTYKYHPSDHIIAGKTETLLKVFKQCKEECEKQLKIDIVPEQHYASTFIEIMEQESIKKTDTYSLPSEEKLVTELMQKYFDIVPSENLGMFCISKHGEYFINNFKYFTKENDIKEMKEL